MKISIPAIWNRESEAIITENGRDQKFTGFDDEKHVGNSLVDILTMKIVSDIEADVWSRFWIWNSVEILIQKFGQDLEAGVWLKFCSWILTNLWHNLKAVSLVKARNP